MTDLTGAWPVVLTPFTSDDDVDHDALAAYVEWLIASGANGLFAVALSGEMYELTSTERVAVARTVVDATAGRVPVAASVVSATDTDAAITEARELAEVGVDIVVLIASAFVADGEPDEKLVDAVGAIGAALPDVQLGLYECPIPYHRLLSEETVAALAATGRVAFFKETTHDVDRMGARVAGASGTPLRVFNAGIENLAESVEVGVAGLSGWVVNVAPDLVARLCERAAVDGLSSEVLELQHLLGDVEQRMAPTYPSSAKAIAARRAGLTWQTRSRWRPRQVNEELVAELAAILDDAR
ncbi:dihydrodipicolinate synthase family protein [Microbacterium radiodurans]|uniref:Dihydrodipicolinate synthase family protein n=1 Tax=Microbacterium radiodurans TaxID=661398 RepID=A0A5J5IPM4_9MICO|nr:dihydrodipicolinate synthase family protein [Microbacterium radiodurans]KAA9085317.1 dihydrodipicolinate synthase family protein [Microbacterium radiodurans]